jgi:hypothetical protein
MQFLADLGSSVIGTIFGAYSKFREKFFTQKRIVYEVRYNLALGQWISYRRDKPTNVIISTATKTHCIEQMRSICRQNEILGMYCQMIIHGRDGKIQTEFTYGNDNRKVKG